MLLKAVDIHMKNAHMITYYHVPVHAREVSPKVARSVGRGNFHCIDQNRITLKDKREEENNEQ